MSIWTEASCNPCTDEVRNHWTSMAFILSDIALAAHEDMKNLVVVALLETWLQQPAVDPFWTETLLKRAGDVRDLLVDYTLIGVETKRKGTRDFGDQAPGCIALCSVQQKRSQMTWEIVGDIVAGLHEDPEGLPLAWATVGPRPTPDDPTEPEYVDGTRAWYRTLQEIENYTEGGFAQAQGLEEPAPSSTKSGGAGGAALIVGGLVVWLLLRRRR